MNRCVSPHVLAREQPAIAQDAFNKFDEALNAMLPGSDMHERYNGIEEVGLAAVLASGVLFFS